MSVKINRNSIKCFSPRLTSTHRSAISSKPFETLLRVFENRIREFQPWKGEILPHYETSLSPPVVSWSPTWLTIIDSNWLWISFRLWVAAAHSRFPQQILVVSEKTLGAMTFDFETFIQIEKEQHKKTHRNVASPPFIKFSPLSIINHRIFCFVYSLLDKGLFLPFRVDFFSPLFFVPLSLSFWHFSRHHPCKSEERRDLSFDHVLYVSCRCWLRLS